MNAYPDTLCRDIPDHWKTTTGGNDHLRLREHCQLYQRLVNGTWHDVMSSHARTREQASRIFC